MNLTQAREHAKKSRSQLAEELDVDYTFIWHLERGTKGISLEKALKLKELLPKLDLATLAKSGKEVA
jgi:DNA-binding XRE family transcriptional regulator